MPFTPSQISPLFDVVDHESLLITDLLSNIVYFNQWKAGNDDVAFVEDLVAGVSFTQNLPLSPAHFPTISLGVGRDGFDDVYGQFHLIEKDIDAGAIINEEEHTFYLWSTHRVPKILSSVVANGASGVSLVGDTSETMSPNELNQYTLIISEDGDPVLNATYTFVFDNDTHNPVLSLIGNRLLVIPFPPLDGVKENLSWMTDLIEGYDTEQRIQLRLYPSHTIDMVALLLTTNQTRLNNLIAGWGSNLFGVPIWWENELAGALVSGSSVIAVDTTYAEYRAAGLALVWDSPDNFEAVSVLSVGGSSITLTKGLENNYVNAKVMPMRQGYLAQGVNQSRITDRHTRNQMTFRITDLAEITGASFTQYDGLDVIEDPTISANPLKASIVTPHKFLDNKLNYPQSFVQRDLVRIGDTYNWIKNTDQGRYELLQLLHSRKGRAVPFWLPSWRKDFNLLNTISSGSNSMTVSFAESRHIVGRHFMLKLKNGSVFYRQIQSVVEVGGNDVITYVNPDGADNFGVEVAPADVDRISMLDKMRFNSDTAKIKHEAPNITRLTMPVMTFDTQ